MVKRLGLQKFIWLCLGLLIWESTLRIAAINPQLMPSMLDVVVRLIEGLVTGDLVLQMAQSMIFVIAGLMIGLILAMAMAVLGYFSQWLSSLFDVYASVLHPLPGVALLPIVILWFGIGAMAAFVVIIHAVVWSQYMTIRDGFKQLDPCYIEVAGNNGANKWQLTSHVLVPLSMNAILLSLQIGWSRGWRALISAEMIVGAISALGGIGWYMYERRAFMDTAGMFSGIIAVVIVGVVMEQLVFNRWLAHLYHKS